MIDQLPSDCMFCILEYLDDCSLFSFTRLNTHIYNVMKQLLPTLCSHLLQVRHGFHQQNLLQHQQHLTAIEMMKQLFCLQWNTSFIPHHLSHAICMKNQSIAITELQEWICIPTTIGYSLSSKVCYYFSIQIDHLENIEKDSCHIVIGFISPSFLTKKGESFGVVYGNGFKIHSHQQFMYELFDKYVIHEPLQNKDIITVKIIKQGTDTIISYKRNDKELGVAFALPTHSVQQLEKNTIIPAISIHGTVQVTLLPFSKQTYQSI